MNVPHHLTDTGAPKIGNVDKNKWNKVFTALKDHSGLKADGIVIRGIYHALVFIEQETLIELRLMHRTKDYDTELQRKKEFTLLWRTMYSTLYPK
jgi:hypothetical protein